MTWRGDQLSRIAGSEELQISTRRLDGTLRRWTPIWVVRVGDALYIRSAGHPRSCCGPGFARPVWLSKMLEETPAPGALATAAGS